MNAQTSQKKVVSRTVAIALGIVCIMLLVGLVRAIVLYSSQVNDKDRTISDLQSQISTLNSQKSDLQTQVNTLTSQVSSLNSQVSSLQSQITSLNSQITNLQSQVSALEAHGAYTIRLNTLVYHVQKAPNITHIYQEILTLNNGTYDVLLLPQVYESWDEYLEFLSRFESIPIMLEVFGAGDKPYPVPQLSSEQILDAMEVSNVKWLRICEVISYHRDRGYSFPTEYVTSLLQFARDHNLKVMWTEWSIDHVYQDIQTYITGFEDVVTVCVSTNSSWEPEDCIQLLINFGFQHWGMSVQAWYWETRHRGSKDPIELTYDMPISLLVEHALSAKNLGAELIQFEPYWYFFDNGEARETLRPLEFCLNL